MTAKPLWAYIKDERMKLRGPTPEELMKTIDAEAMGPKSKEILKKGLKYESMAHLYFALFASTPVIERGEGARVFDADGNEYLDMISGFAVHNIGYREEIFEAIKEESKRLLLQYCEGPNTSRTELAEKLCKVVMPNVDTKVWFGATGGEAVEFAMKLARYYTGKPTILGFTGAYHGRTFGVMNVTCDYSMRPYQGFPLDLGVTRVPYPYTYRYDFDTIGYIEELYKCKEFGHGRHDGDFRINDIAAILPEPLQGHGGYIIPPDNFMPELRRLTEENNSILIADEVQCGMARTGKWWAYELSNIEPDIVTIAKSIGAGIPLSAVVAKSEIMDEVGPGGHSTTYGGTPIAAAVGCAVMDIIEKEKLYDQAKRKGDYFLKGLKELQEKHELIGHVDGRGLFIGMELVEDR
jgi:4-aminobutyrate aminotransferase-like enzyme